MAHSLAHLDVICGPMFSGKTTELIRRLREYGSPNGGVNDLPIAIKPDRDDRYAAAQIVSHAGDRLEAISVSSAAEVLGVVAAAGAGAVGIDEAHFFGVELIGPVQQLLRRGLRVVVAGLERDHRGAPFEPFPWLLCEADEVLKLAGPCAACGRPAIHTQRMVASSERIVVGGAEAYQPRCRACFVPGQ